MEIAINGVRKLGDDDVQGQRRLLERDLNTLHEGGVFAGRTPHNVVLNGADLDEAIDAGMLPAA